MPICTTCRRLFSRPDAVRRHRLYACHARFDDEYVKSEMAKMTGRRLLKEYRERKSATMKKKDSSTRNKKGQLQYITAEDELNDSSSSSEDSLLPKKVRARGRPPLRKASTAKDKVWSSSDTEGSEDTS
jgi:hypothetical protein